MTESAEATSTPVVKRFLFVNRKAPHGTVYALEGLEMVLIAAMFEQDVHLAFLDDGVFQLRRNQAPTVLEMKDFSKTYRALEGYGIDKVFVETESLSERGLSPDELVIPVTAVGRAEMTALMNSMDVVLSA
jgi:tRNA 2-thiouridine synthesizing protein C